ncbi:MAG: hypothetical protein E7340_02065 [Clostridiales bacterium]|nr:hypothetical protein [Clostridiales bacterium]
MDNKITKKRLSDFLSYEWIKLIIVCVVAVLLWEMVYTVTAVKPTVGQKFKYYFDTSVYGNSTQLNALIEDEDALSYDVLMFNSEQLSTDFNALPTRLTVQEGDILITDCRANVSAEYEKGPFVRAKFVIDNYYAYCYEDLLKDAQNYLLVNFLKDGLTAENAFSAFNEDYLDIEKISKVFRERMAKDNRFRTESQKAEGVFLEKERVTRLYKEVIDFAKLLAFKETDPDLFLTYTKYDQSLIYPGDISLDYWKKEQQKEIDAGRVNATYALKVDALSKYQDENSKKVNPSKYFMYYGEYDAKDICITVFDFKAEQPHLQYETIPFINAIVRSCSTILD